MSRLVLDTNCLIQIISPKSKFHCLWDNFMNGKDTLCISNEILEEYIEILQKLIGIETAELVVKTLINSPFTIQINPYYHFGLIELDPDDNKFVDCAIAAHAKCIVTNDRHYDILKEIEFPKVYVVNLIDYIKTFCKPNIGGKTKCVKMNETLNQWKAL